MQEQITQLTPRQIYSRAWREANKTKIAEKAQDYRKANKTKIAEQQRAYYEANKASEQAKMRAYYEANKDSEKEKMRAYYEANKDSEKEKMRAWREANKSTVIEKKRAYYEANKASEQAKMRAWHKANPEYGRNAYAKRLAAPGEITPGWIPKLLELQRWTCIVCNVDLRFGYHIDHITPIARGGENTEYNLQALCPKCNLEKSDKDPIDFMQSRGFLL